MRIRDFVDSLDLSDRQSARMNCPVCGSKNTFTAYNDGGSIIYNCYKLSCTVSGMYFTDMCAAEISMRLSKVQPVEPDEPQTMEIPEHLVKPREEHKKFWKFINKWDIPSDLLMYDVVQDRVVFPIFYKGRIIDAIGRAVGLTRVPKWLRYTGVADYYLIGSTTSIVIVEDILSAIIVNQEVPGLSAMAILGTSLTDKQMGKLGEMTKVGVALDPDAMYKTLQYKREIEAWTGLPTVAIKLDDDLKYRKSEDIQKVKELCS